MLYTFLSLHSKVSVHVKCADLIAHCRGAESGWDASSCAKWCRISESGATSWVTEAVGISCHEFACRAWYSWLYESSSTYAVSEANSHIRLLRNETNV